MAKGIGSGEGQNRFGCRCFGAQCPISRKSETVDCRLPVRHNKGDRLLYRSAEKLEGPWSEPKVLIAVIPEVNPTDPKYHKNNFCYAGKEHIQFAKEGKLVTTYVCNSLDDPDKRINLSAVIFIFIVPL